MNLAVAKGLHLNTVQVKMMAQVIEQTLTGAERLDVPVEIDEVRDDMKDNLKEFLRSVEEMEKKLETYLD